MIFFFQAEDGIRDLVRSRGLGDVYKRQTSDGANVVLAEHPLDGDSIGTELRDRRKEGLFKDCLLYTSDAADERSSVDLGGRRIIKKKNTSSHMRGHDTCNKYRRTTMTTTNQSQRAMN